MHHTVSKLNFHWNDTQSSTASLEEPTLSSRRECGAYDIIENLDNSYKSKY